MNAKVELRMLNNYELCLNPKSSEIDEFWIPSEMQAKMHL